MDLVQQVFTLRLGGFLESNYDIQVAIEQAKVQATSALTPALTAAPIVEATPETRPPVPVVEATPVPRLNSRESESQPDSSALLILDVEKAVNSHDWRTLTGYTADGLVNYFGRLHISNAYIQRDMEQDARTYSSAHSTRYLDTFTHVVSSEYSSHWNGAMLYDSINVYSEIRERHGRLHRAMSRLTVGYTLENGVPTIYSLTMKVL